MSGHRQIGLHRDPPGAIRLGAKHFRDVVIPAMVALRKTGDALEVRLAATDSGVDVLIVGCGPAGLTLAAQLSAFADIRTCIVEQKASRLLRGQADGVACRTMEMFNAFGFAERVLKESCWITETTF